MLQLPFSFNYSISNASVFRGSRYATREQKAINYKEDSDEEAEREHGQSSDDDASYKARQPRKKRRRVTLELGPFRFKDLPEDIRVGVYKHCFDQEGGDYTVGDGYTDDGVRLRLGMYKREEIGGRTKRGLLRCRNLRIPRQINVALLQTSRGISIEASKVLCCHPLKFVNVGAMQMFLARHQATVKNLRHINLHYPSPWDWHRSYRTWGSSSSMLMATLCMLGPAVELQTLHLPTCYGEMMGIGTPPLLILEPDKWSRQMSYHAHDMFFGLALGKLAFRWMDTLLTNFVRHVDQEIGNQPQGINPVFTDAKAPAAPGSFKTPTERVQALLRHCFENEIKRGMDPEFYKARVTYRENHPLPRGELNSAPLKKQKPTRYTDERQDLVR